MKNKPKVIGISASLRNARFGKGCDQLAQELAQLSSKEELLGYLQGQSKICVEDFVAAGREQGASFDEIYTNLLKRQGDQGLSNSEVALAAGLWGVKNQNVDIEHVGLAQYFPAAGSSRNVEDLIARLMTCEGLLISGPVYFGDRGSLTHSFIELIRNTPPLREYLQGKVYAGISVGAKRNGGQETTLVYQMLDMVNLGMLAVGNDSDTTSQYGGTCKGGDVGTVVDDDYGLDTSIGVGRRIGRVVRLKEEGQEARLKKPTRIAVWLLQDKGQQAEQHIKSLIEKCSSEEVDFTVHNFTQEYVQRCIACDICPTRVDVDKEYRCIIRKPKDLFKRDHEKLLCTDAILLAAYSPREFDQMASVYQKFMERTRYLRRGDYVFTDMLVAPLIIEEVGACENLHIRMMTSLIRHHTVMSAPIIGRTMNGELLYADETISSLNSFCEYAGALTAARLKRALIEENTSAPAYNPVGYVLSTEKNRGREEIEKREGAVRVRNEALVKDADDRLRTG